MSVRLSYKHSTQIAWETCAKHELTVCFCELWMECNILFVSAKGLKSFYEVVAVEYQYQAKQLEPIELSSVFPSP